MKYTKKQVELHEILWTIHYMISKQQSHADLPACFVKTVQLARSVYHNEVIPTEKLDWGTLYGDAQKIAGELGLFEWFNSREFRRDYQSKYVPLFLTCVVKREEWEFLDNGIKTWIWASQLPRPKMEDSCTLAQELKNIIHTFFKERLPVKVSQHIMEDLDAITEMDPNKCMIGALSDYLINHELFCVELIVGN